MDEYTIDDLCNLTGCTRRTIRYYLQIGLLPPPRGGGRKRVYCREHLLRLQAIRALQRERFSLKEIRNRLLGLTEGEFAELLAGLADEPRPAPTFHSKCMAYKRPEQNQFSMNAIPASEPAEATRSISVSAKAWHQWVIEVVDGVELVVSRPLTPELEELLAEAARRAAEILLEKPWVLVSQPDQ